MTFCTAINCMDGRIQLPVNGYLREKFGAEYVDTITEAGPNRILAEGTDAHVIESIVGRLRISVEQHGSVGIAVIGHHDCARNPSPKPEQDVHTRAAMEVVRKWYPNLPVIGLWVDADWTVREVEE